MMIGWLGGDGALSARGITAAEQKSFRTFPFDSNVFKFDDTKESHEALSLGCSVAAIQAQYECNHKSLVLIKIFIKGGLIDFLLIQNH